MKLVYAALDSLSGRRLSYLWLLLVKAEWNLPPTESYNAAKTALSMSTKVFHFKHNQHDVGLFKPNEFSHCLRLIQVSQKLVNSYI